MDRAGKAALKEQIDAKLTKTQAILLAEYRGMTVEKLTQLRRELRTLNAEFKVAKNRIAKISVNAEPSKKFAAAAPNMKGPLGMIFIYGDAAPVAKRLLDFEKENELFAVKAGVLDGKEVKKDDLDAIAKLPTKEVLLAQIMGCINGPARNLVQVMAATVRNVVQVAAAVRDAKK
jgi:large subunit ribosomal protein L10